MHSLDADRCMRELGQEDLLQIASNPFYLSVFVEVAQKLSVLLVCFAVGGRR